jgi:SAM-dependent methyltransferase
VASAARDRWAEWLGERRFGGDPEIRERTLEVLTEVRERVLDRAAVREGDTVLDVGCGEGLIGFGALERGAGTVIFSDVSADLLDFCREAATGLGVPDRCRFVEASAEDLGRIADASVDVVTTRSVLIYVNDKASAFGEFARALRPGGRISLHEPINRFGAEGRRRRGGVGGYRADGLEEIAARVSGVFEALQPLDSDPMLDFDERDLVRLAEEAAFFPIRLTLDVRIEALEPRRWDGFLDAAGNPNIPTLREAMEQVLSAEEREELGAGLRPLVERGEGEWRMAFAYLVGMKPDSSPC